MECLRNNVTWVRIAAVIFLHLQILPHHHLYRIFVALAISPLSHQHNAYPLYCSQYGYSTNPYVENVPC